MIGGDYSPAGPFRASLDLLATGVVERSGIDSVAFAGYPEGHPAIDAHTLDAAMQAKVALARQCGLEVSLVSQFGFEAAPILRWIASLRAQGIACPVRIGVAGPARVATLAKYAVRCGIGASLRALARGHTAFARILTEAGPDALIAELVAGEVTDVPIEGLHVYAFGGVGRTAQWICSARHVGSNRK
jgi:methylenetetrahydrofolate reductase (NADPH)